MPVWTPRRLALATSILLAAALGLEIGRILVQVHQVEQAAKVACRRQAVDAAGAVQAQLTALEVRGRGLVQALEKGDLPVARIQDRMAQVLAGAPPSVSRMGVLFEPGPVLRGPRGPYVERDGAALRRYDYAARDAAYHRHAWYADSLRQGGWSEPYPDPVTGEPRVNLGLPFRLPGSRQVSGLVRLELTLVEIQDMVGSLAPGRSGYGFLLSAKGVYLADPVHAHVRNRDTFAAAAQGDAGRLEIARAAAGHRPGFAVSRGGATGRRTWIFLEPVASSGWSLGEVILRDELVLEPPGFNRTLVVLVTLAALLGLDLLCLALLRPGAGPGARWRLALGGSLVAAAATACLWHFAYVRPAAPRSREVEVMSEASREAFLDRYRDLGTGIRTVATTFVPTGLFIQQMDFAGDGQMRISGQVWQRLPEGFPPEARGVTFPEAVSCEFGSPFERRRGDRLVQVTPFKGLFRLQPGTVVTYPFDRGSVRLRIWTRLFYSNVVLVPDLASYTILAPVSRPGLDSGLALSGWDLVESHFSFLVAAYNTDFGISDYAGQQDSPELMFSFSMRRAFVNPFIATFLPLLVVAVLLFALVLTTTREREQMAQGGYSLMNLLRAVTALFFPVVLAQINLRNHVVTEGLLYVEYFYFVVYLLILLAALNALGVWLWDHPVLQRRNNEVAKLAYWPLATGAFYAISILYLW